MENWNISLYNSSSSSVPRTTTSKKTYSHQRIQDDISEDNIEDEREKNVIKVIEDWITNIKKMYIIPNFAIPSAYETRITSWGTLIPMCYEEEQIHLSILRGLGIEYERLTKNRRYIKVGEWIILNQIHLSLVILQPAIATASVVVTSLNPNDVMKSLSNLEIVSPSSSGRDSTIITNETFRRRVIGRKALSVVRLSKKNTSPELPVIYAHASYSSLLFIVTVGSETHCCTFSSETITLLRGILADQRNILFHDDCMNIYSWDRRITNNTHIKISKDGDISLLGSPKHFEQIMKGFKDVFYAIMQVRSRAFSFISTLRIVES